MKKGWPIKTLAEVCEIKPPKAESRRRLFDTDVVSFLPMQNLELDQKIVEPTQTKMLAEVAGSYTYFADGDVLLAKITPCFENGKLGIAANLTNGIGFGSSEYIVFRPATSVDKEWLYYYLSREVFRSEGAAQMYGAVGHKRVAKEFIESYPIPLPPLPEQKRIVALLDEAFAGIATAVANTEKNLANARELFDSYLNNVFTQKGDAVREGWPIKTLAEVCEIKPPKAESRRRLFDTDVVSFLPMQNLELDQKIVEPTQTKMLAEVAGSYTYFADGDVLLAKITPCFENGKLGIAANLTNGIGFGSSEYIVFRPATSVDKEWLYYYLSREVFRSEGAAQMYGAVGHKRVAKEFIESYPIPLPPLPEQKHIVSRLNALSSETHRLQSLYQHKRTTLAELKQSLLHKAFSGALTSQSVSVLQEAVA